MPEPTTKQTAPDPALPDTHQFLQQLQQYDPNNFPEVPKHFIDGCQWSIVQSRRWSFKENILKTEGRAVIWGLRRLVRSVKNHNVKHLFLAAVWACVVITKQRSL